MLSVGPVEIAAFLVFLLAVAVGGLGVLYAVVRLAVRHGRQDAVRSADRSEAR